MRDDWQQDIKTFMEPFTGSLSFTITEQIKIRLLQSVFLMPNNWLKMHGYPKRRKRKND